MQKIPTIFVRNPDRPQFVAHEPNPDALWVFEGHGTPTVKKDGTNVAVEIHGTKHILWKRRNPTREEKAAGAEPGYVEADPDDPADKHLYAAFDATDKRHWPEGLWPCEALGPKIQGGVESTTPCLYAFSLPPPFTGPEILPDCERTYEGIRDFLTGRNIEGIVWHRRNEDGTVDYAKIKSRDFSLPWPPQKRKSNA